MPDKSNNGHDFGFPPLMAPIGFEALMEMNRPALSAMAEVNGKVYENLATLNKSWVAFVNRRLKEDFSVPKQLAECKTVQDMYSVYADFFQTAVTDYQSELEQWSKLGKSMADDTAQAMQSRLEETARAARSHG